MLAYKTYEFPTLSCDNTCDRITIVYLRVVYGQIRRYTDENAIVYGRSKRRLHTISVFSPYTDQYDRIRIRRYTIVIRSQVLRQNMVVNDRIFPVYGCIRPFTEFVTFDLGMHSSSNGVG